MYHHHVVLKHYMEKVGSLLPNATSDLFKVAVKRSIAYLEDSASITRGYSNVTFLADNPSISCSIPTAFDTALTLPLLQDIPGFSQKVIDHLAGFIRSDKRENGYWNYILNRPEMDELTHLMPDDVDDTCAAVMALHKTGAESYANCQSLIRAMIDDTIFHENGIFGTWISSRSSKLLYPSLLNSPKIDLGVLANIIFCLGTFSLDSDPRLSKTLDFVKNAVEKLSFKDMRYLQPYYGEKYFVMFLLTRSISASKLAKQKFGSALAHCIVNEIECLSIQECHKPFSLASILLASLEIGIHSFNNEFLTCKEKIYVLRKKILDLTKKLLQMQKPEGFYESAGSFVYFFSLNHNLFSTNEAFITALALKVALKVSQECCDNE